MLIKIFDCVKRICPFVDVMQKYISEILGKRNTVIKHKSRSNEIVIATVV